MLGLQTIALPGGAPDFTQNTYAQLVADTLGNVGAEGDDLDVSAAALAALMAAYEAEVQDGLAVEDVPAYTGAAFDTTIEDAALASLAVADAEEIAINGGLQFLFDTFGAWGDLLGAVNGLIGLIGSVFGQVQGEISILESIVASLQLGGGGGSGCTDVDFIQGRC
jgi:hypothetical protein